jgi:membrane protein implicated in regulation of membrane protease activity
MLAGGAVGASIAAAFGAPPVVQAIVAGLVAVALLAIVRPWLKNRIQASSPQQLMGAAAHVGRSAVAIDRVNPAGGQVKLAGQTWSARTLGDDIEPGEEVVVDSIDGATAIVSRARVVGS